ncbi:MAG: hypothetical protein RJB18_1139 [Pseudomonadota bacterium]|jgi:hypothetical protein
MFTRYAKRLTSWIAILAVVFASLAPSISHAFPAKNNQPTLLQELCSAQGAKRFIAVDLAVDTQKAPTQNQAAMHFEHCPYCATHAGTVAIPATSIALFLAEINATEHIQIDAQVLPSSFDQVTPPSHAPPAISI